jgi:uncharacterized protein YukE
MSLDIPLETVEIAESKLSAAEDDLKATMNQTRNTAISQLGDAIRGDINVACTELVNTWSNEMSQVATILSNFKAALLSTRTQMSEDSATQARSISDIDVHAARLG